MSKRLETVLSVILTVAAVAVASAVIWRQFFAMPGAARSGVLEAPKYYENWTDWKTRGVTRGRDSAAVALLLFSDLECPYCGKFHLTALEPVMTEFGDQVSVTFVHLPLTIHRFAEISGVAAECAADQDRFWEFVDILFAHQDSVGLKSWTSFAVDAGVGEPDTFLDCLDGGQTKDRVLAGRRLADELGLSATPTVFVNGWRLPIAPTKPELSDLVRDILEGREPFSVER